jgi:hypothetical protein
MQKVGSSAQAAVSRQLSAISKPARSLKHERRGGNLLLPVLGSAYEANLKPDFE